MRARLISVIVPLLVLAMGVVGTAAAAPGSGERVDVIVVLHDGEDARDAARDAHGNHDADVRFVYEHALQGFAASVPQGRLHALTRDPRVDYVEVDRLQRIQAQTTPTGIQRISADDNTGLDIDGSDDWRVDVDVAVVDTGIDLEHPDLNVAGGVDCTVSSGGGPPWRRTYYCSSTEGTRGDDDHYHGTHVAGTIGAIDDGNGVVGVAPGARLWAVKVLDSSGSGYTSGIVAGIDWVVARGDIEVLNMSLGGSGSCSEGSAYDDAIDTAVASGVAVAVAAGNSDANSNNYSPASCDNAFAVSALADFNGAPGGGATRTCRDDQDDTLADFSNWGSAVDLAAPGVCILSTYPIEQGSYGTISGTSMASPHVAGAFALLASSAPNGPTKGGNAVAALYSDVVAAGNLDWSDDSGDGIKERLLDVSNTTLFSPALVAGGGDTGGDGGGDGGGGGEPPTGDFALSTSGHKVQGRHHVDLTWTGTDGTGTVEVLLNGTPVGTTTDDGSATWTSDNRGGATYIFQVCEVGTTTCSNASTVVF